MEKNTPILTLVAGCDDLFRSQNVLADGTAEEEFLRFAQFQEGCRMKWLEAVVETRRLQTELEKAQNEISKLDFQLRRAQKMYDGEKRKMKDSDSERQRLEEQIQKARILLFSDDCNAGLNNETLSKLAFLNSGSQSKATLDTLKGRLDTIAEGDINTTGTLLSDLSYSCSGDDLERSNRRTAAYRKNRYSGTDLDESVDVKRRRSSGRHETNAHAPTSHVNKSSTKVVEISNTERVVATTTVTVPKDGMGPIVARSVIEAVPDNGNNEATYMKKPSLRELFAPTAPLLDLDSVGGWSRDVSPSAFSRNLRPHNFMDRMSILRPEPCGGCHKRIRFGRGSLKCKGCRAISHVECKDMLPLPCIPVGNTPTMKGSMGSIADYTPNTAPMVPSIVVHCVNEVESRGLTELGIYRIPGSEKDVKALKERFLRGKGVPNLAPVDIHVICGCLKDFLRSITEPLITRSLWSDFVHAMEGPINEGTQALYRAISDLPQPNRDTLAYLIMHLQRVAECREVKMPIGNIAKIFGPTIVGYSEAEPNPVVLLTETKQQVAVMESLLNIPTDYWAMYVCIDIEPPGSRNQIIRAPSKESVAIETPHRDRYETASSEGRRLKRVRKPLY